MQAHTLLISPSFKVLVGQRVAVVLNHVIVQHGLVDPVLGPAHKLRYGLHVLTLLSQVLGKQRRRGRRAVKMEFKRGRTGD